MVKVRDMFCNRDKIDRTADNLFLCKNVITELCRAK